MATHSFSQEFLVKIHRLNKSPKGNDSKNQGLKSFFGSLLTLKTAKKMFLYFLAWQIQFEKSKVAVNDIRRKEIYK